MIDTMEANMIALEFREGDRSDNPTSPTLAISEWENGHILWGSYCMPTT